MDEIKVKDFADWIRLMINLHLPSLLRGNYKSCRLRRDHDFSIIEMRRLNAAEGSPIEPIPAGSIKIEIIVKE